MITDEMRGFVRRTAESIPLGAKRRCYFADTMAALGLEQVDAATVIVRYER